MAGQALRLDRGLVGLTLLAGASMSMGFIQLLAGPLENAATISVQVLAVQTTAMAAPLVITLLLLLREGPALVALGTRLAHRPQRALLRRWLHQATRLIPAALALLPYLLTAAMVSAVSPDWLMVTTRPVSFSPTAWAAANFSAAAFSSSARRASNSLPIVFNSATRTVISLRMASMATSRRSFTT